MRDEKAFVLADESLPGSAGAIRAPGDRTHKKIWPFIKGRDGKRFHLLNVLRSF